MNPKNLAPALLKDMKSKGVDIALSLEILVDLREVGAAAVREFRYEANAFKARVESLGLDPKRFLDVWRMEKDQVVLTMKGLESLGFALMPRCAYGVLNGGSATSYGDPKKNSVFGQEVWELLRSGFEALAPQCFERPKGTAPAYLNPDGSPGASFLELKMRARLLLLGKSRDLGFLDASDLNPLPLYQMTSPATERPLADFYARAMQGPYLSELGKLARLPSSSWAGASQPLICAYTHSAEGYPKAVFSRANGMPSHCIALPGGHGQCFRVLADTFRQLRKKGVRFAFLGNVDNIGYVPEPRELALFALSGQPAAFEFAPRSPMDVKGGVLVRTSQEKLTVVDIGPAISIEDVRELEHQGSTILFNCASGIFDLDYLLPRIDSIAKNLPLRVSDQDRSSGKYSQAEQITWEITEILPSFLAFVISKEKRFIAAKLLVDTLLTSGAVKYSTQIPPLLRDTALKLHEGLKELLSTTYGMEIIDERWRGREAQNS
ncbi:MAG: UDP-glucose pyrophosphorylase [Spirochaetes bacterium]|nr:MAG: UDP-glucose pyrophosphorylase [Spirochaetota bacterium]